MINRSDPSLPFGTLLFAILSGLAISMPAHAEPLERPAPPRRAITLFSDGETDVQLRILRTISEGRAEIDLILHTVLYDCSNYRWAKACTPKISQRKLFSGEAAFDRAKRSFEVILQRDLPLLAVDKLNTLRSIHSISGQIIRWGWYWSANSVRFMDDRGVAVSAIRRIQTN